MVTLRKKEQSCLHSIFEVERNEMKIERRLASRANWLSYEMNESEESLFTPPVILFSRFFFCARCRWFDRLFPSEATMNSDWYRSRVGADQTWFGAERLR